jgi:hypothetical protein
MVSRVFLLAWIALVVGMPYELTGVGRPSAGGQFDRGAKLKYLTLLCFLRLVTMKERQKQGTANLKQYRAMDKPASQPPAGDSSTPSEPQQGKRLLQTILQFLRTKHRFKE